MTLLNWHPELSAFICFLQLTGKSISGDFSWDYVWKENATGGLQATDLLSVKGLSASYLSVLFLTLAMSRSEK